MTDYPLGRRPPTDDQHVQLWPLTATVITHTGPSSGVLGSNWYEGFDEPEYLSGRWWIGRNRPLGRVRGGHAICVRGSGIVDGAAWHLFYNQGVEGACVGFAASRVQSHHNRERYDARWLYRTAQQQDEWPGESYEGTSVRAGLDVLREQGHRRVYRGISAPADLTDGILHNRWATSTNDILAALGNLHATAVPLLNSWGLNYPRTVWLPVAVLDRLFREDGEFAIVTDR